jgi:BirA family biotin operon repressor/biotin-[acetyl-CoA-carboxylase] ligase
VPGHDARVEALSLARGVAVERVAATGSTNDDLLARIRDAAASKALAFAPCLLVAERQHAGRGRHGRAWHGSAGRSLALSLAWPSTRADLSGLSLAVGTAIADALDPPGPTPRIGLKWPNDLWLLDRALGDPHMAGRKLAGILIETAPLGNSRVAVIGVGINVVAQAVADAASGVASVTRSTGATPATTLAARVAPWLFAVLRSRSTPPASRLADRFAARDPLRGGAAGRRARRGRGNRRRHRRRRQPADRHRRRTDRRRQRRMAPRSHRAAGRHAEGAAGAAGPRQPALLRHSRGRSTASLGLRSLGDREPERLANQVRPQTIRFAPTGSAASAPADAGVPCYETPTFTAGEAGAVEAALAANLPAGAWTDNPRRAQPRHAHRGDAHLPRHRHRCDAGGAAGDAAPRRRRARLQLQSCAPAASERAPRVRRLLARRASASEHRREHSSSQPTPSAPPPPPDVPPRASPAVSPTTGAMTVTDSRGRDEADVVGRRSMTNDPACRRPDDHGTLLAPVIVAPLVPALRIVQA